MQVQNFGVFSFLVLTSIVCVDRSKMETGMLVGLIGDTFLGIWSVIHEGVIVNLRVTRRDCWCLCS